MLFEHTHAGFSVATEFMVISVRESDHPRGMPFEHTHASASSEAKS
jgi:hypothetical protein